MEEKKQKMSSIAVAVVAILMGLGLPMMVSRNS